MGRPRRFLHFQARRYAEHANGSGHVRQDSRQARNAATLRASREESSAFPWPALWEAIENSFRSSHAAATQNKSSDRPGPPRPQHREMRKDVARAARPGAPTAPLGLLRPQEGILQKPGSGEAWELAGGVDAARQGSGGSRAEASAEGARKPQRPQPGRRPERAETSTFWRKRAAGRFPARPWP